MKPSTLVSLSVTALLACSEGAPNAWLPGAPIEPSALIELGAADIEVLGTSDSLSVVRDMEVLRDGSVWVLNSQPPFFVGYGPDGESLGAHGRSGGGPGEFRMPSAFVTGRWDGEAWIFDIGRHAIVRISEPGGNLPVIPLPSATLPPGSALGGMHLLSSSVRTARLGNEIIVPRSTETLRAGPLRFRFSLLQADLVAVDPETGGTRDLLALAEVLDDLSGDFIPSEGAYPLWYRLWAGCGGDLLRVHDRVRNQLRGFDGSASEVQPIDLPRIPFAEITPRQFAAAVFRMRQVQMTGDIIGKLTEEDSIRVLNRIVQTVRGEPHELASYLPRYVDLRCTEDGTMWLHPLDPDLGDLRGGSVWLQIAPDGDIQEVRLPDRFDAFRFSDSRIWGIYRDDLDLPSVASIALPG